MRKLNEEQLSRVLSECAGPGLKRHGCGVEPAAGRCCLLQAALNDVNAPFADPGRNGVLDDRAAWFDYYGYLERDPDDLLRALEKAGIA